MTVRTTYHSGLLVLLILFLSACGGSDNGTPLPKTFSVTGSVLWKNGQPVQGGMIEFQPVASGQRNSIGDIGSDGTFTLRTVMSGEKLVGAQVGPHRVTVIPASKEHVAKSFLLPETYTIKADTKNEFVITLDE